MKEGEQKILEPYQAQKKLFGDKAERIQKTEYDFIIRELQGILNDYFHKIQPAEQLEDKESFGDIDIICYPKRTIDELYLQSILGTRLLEYSRNGHVHSALIALESGKQIHVDFIQAKSEIDFERKFMYYSKGHMSAIVGMLAKKLHFKYGTEGFFKRFQDKRGNWHDVLVSESLRDGLAAIGLDEGVYDNIHTTEESITFIAQSPFFDSSYFGSENMARRDRESTKRNQTENYMAQRLAEKNQVRTINDENELFKKLFPESFRHLIEESERINRETYALGAINGKKVMLTFGIKPGPMVGKVLKFIGDNYPEAEDLSDEIIKAVKTKVL